MAAFDTFALALLVLSAGALGLIIVIEVSRISVMTGKRALLHKRLEDRRKDVTVLRNRVDETEAAIKKRETLRGELEAQRARLVAMAATIQSDKVELVHELGTPEAGRMLFQAPLRTAPDFLRVEQRHIIFSRDIWQRKNVLHVWAESPDAAHAAVQRAFHARSGVLPGRIVRFMEGGEPAGAP